MDIQQVDLKKAIVCAYLAKEVYGKFPQEVAADPDISENKKFKAFSKFPNANVEHSIILKNQIPNALLCRRIR